MRRWARRIGTVGVVAMLAVAGTAVPAAATATGRVATWGSICLLNNCVPEGAIEHNTSGEGLNVTREVGILQYAVDPICQWHMDFEFFDRDDNRYHHEQGPEHPGCNVRGSSCGNRKVDSKPSRERSASRSTTISAGCGHAPATASTRDPSRQASGVSVL